MMLPTHALAGMVLALPVALAAPELSGVALLAGFVGGVLPDLDLYTGHRKSLHFPTYYAVGGGIAGVVALLAPSGATVALALCLLAAALHSRSDVLGGGLELRPWEGTSDRAVYDHYRGRWLAPRRLVGYDGSRSDLLVSVALAAPLLVTVEGVPWLLAAGSLAVATVYAAVRRLLPRVAEVLVRSVLEPRLPAWLLTRVPARYRGSDRPRAAD